MLKMPLGGGLRLRGTKRSFEEAESQPRLDSGLLSVSPRNPGCQCSGWYSGADRRPRRCALSGVAHPGRPGGCHSTCLLVLPVESLALALGRPTVFESESPKDGPVLASASEDTRVLLEVDGVVLVLATIPHCQRAVCMPVRNPCGPESAERAAVASSI